MNLIIHVALQIPFREWGFMHEAFCIKLDIFPQVLSFVIQLKIS